MKSAYIGKIKLTLLQSLKKRPMKQHVSRPRFFTYENGEVKEVSEKEYYLWSTQNWHPAHLKQSVVKGNSDEVILGFLGHYKFTEWHGKPFNVSYLFHSENRPAIEEYFDTFEEAQERFYLLKEFGYAMEQVLQAA